MAIMNRFKKTNFKKNVKFDRNKGHNRSKGHSRKQNTPEIVNNNFIVKENKYTSFKNNDISEYTTKNLNILRLSRRGSIEFNHPIVKEFNINSKTDWFAADPYTIYIDDMVLCGNIKFTENNVHFHFACGYNPKYEFPGAEDYFSRYRRLLIINKEKVKVTIINGKKYYFVKTLPYDWDTAYKKGMTEKDLFWNDYKNPWDVYQWYVDWLLKINNEELKKINRSDYLKNRSSGEKIISDSLKTLYIRYVPEYIIHNLEGDDHKYRIADFYLPKEDIYIEFNGGLNTPNLEKRKSEILRYADKKSVLDKNNLRIITVYPSDLSHIEYFLALAISDYIKYNKLSKKTLDLQKYDEKSQIEMYTLENRDLKQKINQLFEKLSEMEDKSIINKITKPFKELKKSFSQKILGTKEDIVSKSKENTENRLANLIEERNNLSKQLNEIKTKLNKIKNKSTSDVKNVFDDILEK